MSCEAGPGGVGVASHQAEAMRDLRSTYLLLGSGAGGCHRSAFIAEREGGSHRPIAPEWRRDVAVEVCRDFIAKAKNPGSRGGTHGPILAGTTGWTKGPASPALCPKGKEHPLNRRLHG